MVQGLTSRAESVALSIFVGRVLPVLRVGVALRPTKVDRFAKDRVLQRASGSRNIRSLYSISIERGRDDGALHIDLVDSLTRPELNVSRSPERELEHFSITDEMEGVFIVTVRYPRLLFLKGVGRVTP